MEHKKIDDFKWGWLIGNFTPCLHNMDDIEVGVKVLPKYRYQRGFWENNTEYIVILDGCIYSNGKYYRDNDIIIIPPKEIKDIFTIVDTKVLLIRTPAAKNDLRQSFVSLEKMEEIFRVVERIEKEELSECPIGTIEEKTKMDIADISVVIQGPIDSFHTKEALRSVRKNLPNAKIILSTWEGEDVSQLDYDEVVFSKDPGGFPLKCARGLDNRNRQLVSIVEGLKCVNTKYVLKMRTDEVILNNDFLSLFSCYPKRSKDYRFFESRLMVVDAGNAIRVQTTSSVTKEKTLIEMPYMITNWLMFGLTADMRKYFYNIRLATEEDFTTKYLDKGLFMEDYKLTPEQYFAVNAFKSALVEVNMEDLFTYDESQIELSKKIFLNNFLPIDILKMKGDSLKYPGVILERSYIDKKEDYFITYKQFLEYYASL